MSRFDEAIQVLSEELEMSAPYLSGVLRGLRMARNVGRKGDVTGCVAVQFHHSGPGRVVLCDKTPPGLTIFPEGERTVDRQDNKGST